MSISECVTIQRLSRFGKRRRVIRDLLALGLGRWCFCLPSKSFDEHCTGEGQWIRTVQDPSFRPPLHLQRCMLKSTAWIDPPTTRVIGFTTYKLAANPWHEDESRFDLANAMLSATGPVCPGADVGTVSVAICRPRSRCLPPIASLLTPAGHHGNLLMYSLGHCQFADFILLARR